MTVVVDLTPRKHDRPARLLDMVEGGSEKAFASWLAERPQSFRDHVKAIAMDAFAGYKKAARHGAPRGGGIGVFRQVGVSCLVMYFFRVGAGAVLLDSSLIPSPPIMPQDRARVDDP